VHALETSSRRWREDAEAAEARIARISREKAAAEKAAQVLESLVASQGPHTVISSPYSAGVVGAQVPGEAAAAAATVVVAAAGAGKRRPPAVHADLGMSAYSTPMATPVMAMAAPRTPSSSHTGMAPIGTPVNTSAHGNGGAQLVGGGRMSSRTPVRSLAGHMDGSLEGAGCASRMRQQDDPGWSTAPGTPVCLALNRTWAVLLLACFLHATAIRASDCQSAVGPTYTAPATYVLCGWAWQMDGSAFAAFMGVNSSLEYSLPLEALETDSSSFLGCGNSDCGGERLCEVCERGEGFPGGMEGMVVLDGTVADGWVSTRERDNDAAASVVGSEESSTWPTRARGRRGGRRQKRVGGDGAATAGTGAFAGENASARDRGGDLATSMALAALGDDE